LLLQAKQGSFSSNAYILYYVTSEVLKGVSINGHVAGSTVSLCSLWELNVMDGQQIIIGTKPELLVE